MKRFLYIRKETWIFFSSSFEPNWSMNQKRRTPIICHVIFIIELLTSSNTIMEVQTRHTNMVVGGSHHPRLPRRTANANTHFAQRALFGPATCLLPFLEAVSWAFWQRQWCLGSVYRCSQRQKSIWSKWIRTWPSAAKPTKTIKDGTVILVGSTSNRASPTTQKWHGSIGMTEFLILIGVSSCHSWVDIPTLHKESLFFITSPIHFHSNGPCSVLIRLVHHAWSWF